MMIYMGILFIGMIIQKRLHISLTFTSFYFGQQLIIL